MPVDFTAIDFETANSSSASACSVGLVKVRNGIVVDTFSRLILPPFGHDEFSEWNTRIHGITAQDVQDADTWPIVLDELVEFASGDWLIAHNAGFDMRVLSATSEAVGIPVPDYTYLCSLQIARRTYHLDSYRLPVVAMAAGFEDFRHHDAVADAEACASIVIHAAARHGIHTVGELADVTKVKIGVIGTGTTRTWNRVDGPMALQ